jgi:hypothetical protein
MADIHIRETPQVSPSRREIHLIYHILIATPKAGIVPTPLSSIDSELTQAERDALAAGSLVEISQTLVKNEGDTLASVKAKIQQDWDAHKTAYNADYGLTYQYYGSTLGATA